MWATKQT